MTEQGERVVVESFLNGQQKKCQVCGQVAEFKITCGGSRLHVCGAKICHNKAIELLYVCEANLLE